MDLADVLREQDFWKSRFVSPETAKKAGKLLGALSLLMVSISESSGTIDIFADIVDAETGEIMVSVEASGRRNRIQSLKYQAADELIHEISIMAMEKEESLRRKEAYKIYKLEYHP